MSSCKNLRDFTKPMPEDYICPLCNLDNKECECTKHKCNCKILAMHCIWPDCLCIECLKTQDKCECYNG